MKFENELLRGLAINAVIVSAILAISPTGRHSAARFMRWQADVVDPFLPVAEPDKGSVVAWGVVQPDGSVKVVDRSPLSLKPQLDRCMYDLDGAIATLKEASAALKKVPPPIPFGEYPPRPVNGSDESSILECPWPPDLSTEPVYDQQRDRAWRDRLRFWKDEWGRWRCRPKSQSLNPLR